jgi:hypothetical protein
MRRSATRPVSRPSISWAWPGWAVDREVAPFRASFTWRNGLDSRFVAITKSGHLMLCDKEMCDATLTLSESTWSRRTARNWSEGQGWRNDVGNHDYCPLHRDDRLTFLARNEMP